MELKQCEKIEWHELPRVETPASAHYWVRHHLHTSDVGYLSLLQVQGVREVTRDPITWSCRPWNSHTKEWLLREIETGTVMLLNDFGMEAFDPLYRRQIDPATGEETFIVDPWAAWHAMVRHHADLALWAARETKGIFAPPPLPEQRPPEKKPKPEPEPLTVKNPRWEHVDPNVAEKRRDSTVAGDVVMLKADVKGVPEGTPVKFTLFEASLSPSLRIDTVQGEVMKGIGSAEWEVRAPRRGNASEPALEFEAQVRKVTSERAPLPVTPLLITFSMAMTELPGKQAAPSPHREWRIVRSLTGREAPISNEAIASGESDSSGKIILTGEQEKSVQEAYRQTPKQIWLVTSGPVRKLIIEIESGKWTDEAKLDQALNACGYTGPLKMVQSGFAAGSFHTDLAKADSGEETGAAILAKIKEVTR